MVEDLSETTVAEALQTRWLGRFYYHLPVTHSTNDVLKEMVAAGTATTPPAGAVVLADFQSQGKGRLNRRWQAPAGTSLLMSVLFRPGWPAERAHWLTMIGSLAVVEAVQAETGLAAAVKWPNDLVVSTRGESWRKLGGLLLESGVDDSGRVSTAVLGIGINVNIAASQLPAAATPPTSILAELGRPVARLALLVSILARLEDRYEAAAGGYSPQPAWQARLVTLGRPVRVTNLARPASGRAIDGVAEGTDAWGRLLVRDKAGLLHVIAAGDVTLRPDSNGSVDIYGECL